MNSTILNNSLRFILLVLVQVVLFNHIDLFGFVNPFPYILFILLFPINGNRAVLLFFSFLLGLSIDYFENSGGVHASASLVLAYLRPYIFKFAFGLSYEYQTIRINDRLSPERFTFIVIAIVTHHTILFILEMFNFIFILDILIRILCSTFFTLFTCILIIFLFKPSKR